MSKKPYGLLLAIAVFAAFLIAIIGTETASASGQTDVGIAAYLDDPSLTSRSIVSVQLKEVSIYPAQNVPDVATSVVSEATLRTSVRVVVIAIAMVVVATAMMNHVFSGGEALRGIIRPSARE